MIPTIIYEDNNIIVIDKPTGLVVHPYDYSEENTLLDFLHAHVPEIFIIKNEKKLQDGRIINLGGMVHKLDRDTSGIMVIAKNELVFDSLKKQFVNHTVSKVYIALVEGLVTKNSFTIDAPLGRNKKEYKQSVNPTNLRGEIRDAITSIKVLRKNNTTTLVELTPKTGRTHQLRAHMAYISHPILGDKVYGSKQASQRIMLHAQKISFILDGKDYNFSVEPPLSFTDLNVDTTK